MKKELKETLVWASSIGLVLSAFDFIMLMSTEQLISIGNISSFGLFLYIFTKIRKVKINENKEN